MFDHYPEDLFNTKSADAVLPVLLKSIKPSSVVDVGCGNGSWLKSFVEHGVKDIFGIDGYYVKKNQLLIPEDKFLAADLTKPIDIERRFDLAISLEVAEHLPEEAADIFVDGLVKLSSSILFSAAIPYQGGTEHINEQYTDYWISKFEARGYRTYDILRPKIWNNENIYFWYKQNILLFSKESLKIESESGSIYTNIVHPLLYEAKAKTCRDYENGDQGIQIALRSLFRAVMKKLAII